MGGNIAKLAQDYPGEELFGVYKAVYMGSLPVSEPESSESASLITKTSEDVLNLGQIPRKVWVAVSSKMVRTLGRVTRDLMHSSPVAQIVHCGLTDNKDLRFAYIDKDKKNTIFTCHVYLIKEPAKELPKTITDAFAFNSQQAAESTLNTTGPNPLGAFAAQSVREEEHDQLLSGEPAKDDKVVTFHGRYIGSEAVPEASGSQVVSTAVYTVRANMSKRVSRHAKRFRKHTGATGEPVVFVISSDGVQIYEALTHDVVRNSFIKDITYSSVCQSEKKHEMFVYISKDDRLKRYQCHVFEVHPGTAIQICKALGKALEEYIKQYKGRNAFLPLSAQTDEPFEGILSQRLLARKKLTALKVIGSGQFGKVYLANQVLQGGEVVLRAVKMLRGKSTVDDKLAFLEEMEITADLEHDHVVALVGIAALQRPWLAVLEYMQYGDLKNVLQALREQHLSVTPLEKYHMCRQICSAMKFVASKGYVHMDLACRNCLLHENSVVKVGDFGLAHRVDPTLKTFELTKKAKLSVKWLSPEVPQTKLFSEFTDVWSMGVTMWEVFSGAKMPYEGVKLTEVTRKVRGGLRLPQPEDCPEDFYQVMMGCWNPVLDKRFTFAALEILIQSFEQNASKTCPPVRDIGAIINQDLSDNVRKMSVSASKLQGRKSTIKRKSFVRDPRTKKVEAVVEEVEDNRMIGDIFEEAQAIKSLAVNDNPEARRRLSTASQLNPLLFKKRGEKVGAADIRASYAASVALTEEDASTIEAVLASAGIGDSSGPKLDLAVTIDESVVDEEEEEGRAGAGAASDRQNGSSGAAAESNPKGIPAWCLEGAGDSTNDELDGDDSDADILESSTEEYNWSVSTANESRNASRRASDILSLETDGLLSESTDDRALQPVTEEPAEASESVPRDTELVEAQGQGGEHEQGDEDAAQAEDAQGPVTSTPVKGRHPQSLAAVGGSNSAAPPKKAPPKKAPKPTPTKTPPPTKLPKPKPAAVVSESDSPTASDQADTQPRIAEPPAEMATPAPAASPAPAGPPTLDTQPTAAAAEEAADKARTEADREQLAQDAEEYATTRRDSISDKQRKRLSTMEKTALESKSISSRLKPKTNAQATELTENPEFKKHTEPVEQHSGPFAKAAPQTKHSKIWEALNPQPLFYESPRDRAENETQVVSTARIGQKNYAEMTAFLHEMQDEGFAPLPGEYVAPPIEDDYDDEDMEEFEDTYDPDNLPDFGEYEAEMAELRQNRAKQEKERRAQLRRQSEERRAREQAQIAAELAIIEERRRQEEAAKAENADDFVETAQQRLSELEFSFTFAS
eukprot:m.8472 g.8472  ORF g.8472 m.8472 type:complete len:1308 (+) comp3242_c0_seq1:447-4370(+)